MDSVGAFADHLANLLKPNLSGIYAFQAAADEEAAIVDGKDEGVEELLVTSSLVKRTVEKNTTGMNRHGCLAWSDQRKIQVVEILGIGLI